MKNTLLGSVDMSSKPFRLHVATFKNLRVIQLLGGGSALIAKLKGSYSKALHTDAIKPRSRLIDTILHATSERHLAVWDGNQGTITVDNFLKDIEKDGLDDIVISEMTIAKPTQRFVESTLQNEDMYLPWSFLSLSERPGQWLRLKADIYPSQQLFHDIKKTKKDIQKKLDPEIAKRWRDGILINDPHEHENYDNYEIRQMWQGVRWALILKETQGHFGLMDLGELK